MDILLAKFLIQTLDKSQLHLLSQKLLFKTSSLFLTKHKTFTNIKHFPFRMSIYIYIEYEIKQSSLTITVYKIFICINSSNKNKHRNVVMNNEI